MAHYMVDVVGGDFSPGPVWVITGGWTEQFRRIRSLKRIDAWPIPWVGVITPETRDIAQVDIITQENSTSVLGKAAWATAGALALGPVGLIAGAIGGGNTNKTQALVTFTDGKSVLLSGKAKAINFVVQAVYVKK